MESSASEGALEASVDLWKSDVRCSWKDGDSLSGTYVIDPGREEEEYYTNPTASGPRQG